MVLARPGLPHKPTRFVPIRELPRGAAARAHAAGAALPAAAAGAALPAARSSHSSRHGAALPASWVSKCPLPNYFSAGLVKIVKSDVGKTFKFY